MADDRTSHILVDVRPSVELEICKLSTSESFLSILVRNKLTRSFIDIQELVVNNFLTKCKTDISIQDIENNKNATKIKEKISEMLTILNKKRETISG